MSYNKTVNGNEFIKTIKKIGKRNSVTVRFTSQRGKGSHGTLFYGVQFTVVRNLKDELKTGTLNGMLKQLGISKKEF